ncbi:MAG: acylneuraminate cytidylyltransferase [Candidatus Saganbacteria bacterium]|uniref:Acylneuraminate cytidylyltransferase n=1 Tax=Candidatus Saganbacteria bacterium TaxID=2575572 RepID=A0A833L2F2_UNCSA|nr:MAG: acylneuraminate cytidylyltransferase [Candidatus Saganbacteria bacterium]
MKKAIFITVRTGSSRLPNKCLLKINGKSTIEYLIDRMKRSKKADIIVLCTTELKEDDILCEIANKNSISFYRGSAEDKLMRWYEATKIFDVEFFVTGDGDDIFYDPELVDLAFDQYEKNQPDFIEGKDIICGSFTYAIKTSALKKVCEIKDTEDTEMMWVYFTTTGLFKTEELKNVPAVFKRPEIRMTMDYQDDFKFFKIIIEHFSSEKNEKFTLRDIIDFLDKNPKIVKINQYLQEKYLKNQKMKTKLVLKSEVTR